MTNTNNQTVKFLQDHLGQYSSMRINSLVALLASIVFGIITILNSGTTVNVNGLYITIAFLIAAFAPKALQKFAETNSPTKKKEGE